MRHAKGSKLGIAPPTDPRPAAQRRAAGAGVFPKPKKASAMRKFRGAMNPRAK